MAEERNCLIERLEGMREMYDGFMAHADMASVTPTDTLVNMAVMHDIWQADSVAGTGLLGVLLSARSQLGDDGLLAVSRLLTSMLLRCLMHDIAKHRENDELSELEYMLTEQGAREESAVNRRWLERTGGAPWSKKDGANDADS